jgi:hypothetical protein
VAEDAVVREWGRDNGFELGERGRLPAGVIAAYEAAHAADDGGPDWEAGAAALGIIAGADPLAEDPADDEETSGNSPGSTGDRAAGESTLNGAGTAGPAGPEEGRPVTSLAEARARAGGQPKRPPWAGKDRGGKQPAAGKAPRGRTPAGGRGKPAPDPIEVTPAVVGDIEGKVALLLSFPASGWAYMDPFCGGAMEEALPDTVVKLTPLLCQSQAVVRFLTGADTWIALVGLMVALKPVGIAVYEHHFSPDADKRRAAEQQASAARRGQPVTGDQPPAGPDLSAYTSTPAVSGHVPAYRPA